MITQNEIGRLASADAYDRDGDKIGSIGQVYLDTQSGEPEWVTVKTGLFGTKESFVPLQGANFDGERLTVSAEKARVKDAPKIETDRALSYAEESELYSYYGLTSASGSSGADVSDSRTDYSETRTDSDTRNYQGEHVAGGRRDADYTDDRRETGHTGGDDAMTRSEERLVTDTKTEQTGKARLRKYVVTEQEQVNVPVSREEVRLEREPITDRNAGGAFDGPVGDTEAVPVELVRLGKETVTDEERVSGEVRKEQIDFDGPDDRRTR